MAQQSWTDPALGVNIKAKAVHFGELMDAINAWETAYSIGNTGWTQDPPSTSLPIAAVSVTEMQDAMEAIDALIGEKYAWSWTGAAGAQVIGGGATDHIDQLRSRINIIQNSDCYQCDTCDTYTGCTGCDGTCYIEGCSCEYTCYNQGCSCNVTCYNQGGGCKSDTCTCDGVCYQETCGCNAACYQDTCSICDMTCNGDSPTCTTCDIACHVFTCTCNSTCYEQSCGCNSTCYSQGCGCNFTCYQQAGCKSDTCTCDGSCYQQSCSCNATCYNQGCTCNVTCYQDNCSVCDGTCNAYLECQQCNQVTNRYPW